MKGVPEGWDPESATMKTTLGMSIRKRLAAAIKVGIELGAAATTAVVMGRIDSILQQRIADAEAAKDDGDDGDDGEVVTAYVDDKSSLPNLMQGPRPAVPMAMAEEARGEPRNLVSERDQDDKVVVAWRIAGAQLAAETEFATAVALHMSASGWNGDAETVDRFARAAACWWHGLTEADIPREAR